MRVAVIGANTVGSYVALELAKNGHAVTLYDANKEVGKLACSGLISERIWDYIPRNESLVENEISYFRINFPRKSVDVYFKQKMLVFKRAELDKYVHSLARQYVKFIPRVIKSIPRTYNRVIAADGRLSTARKLLGVEDPPARLGILGYVNERDYSDFVETWPVKDGIIWRIPAGERVEYGIIAPIRTAKQSLNKFLAERRITLEQKHSAIVPCGMTMSNKYNVALIGDAAGLTKPWNGGGIIWSLVASKLLIDSFPDFDKYAEGVRKKFGKVIANSVPCYKLGLLLAEHFSWLFPSKLETDSDFLLPMLA